MKHLAFVGCAHIHTPGFIDRIQKRDDVKVVQVWDHDVERGNRRAQELSALFVADVDAVWSNPSIDAVIICSETDLHEELVLPGAKAGKHLFVEKPLGMGAADGDKMADAIDSARVLFSTGYFMRGNRSVRFIRKLVQDGALGQITRVRGSNCHSGALGGWFDGEWRWMADPARAGVGAFGDLGTHSLDVILWMFGEVDRATAVVMPGTARYEGCDETGEGLMLFKSGVVGTLAAAWDDVANPAELLVSGTEGHVAMLQGQVFVKGAKLEGTDGKEPWRELGDNVPAGLDSWLNAVCGDPSAELVTAREAAYRSAVMEAMYRGAKTGTWVSL